VKRLVGGTFVGEMIVGEVIGELNGTTVGDGATRKLRKLIKHFIAYLYKRNSCNL
jgi:hypothetical protein